MEEEDEHAAPLPKEEDLSALSEKHLGKKPCHWQIKATQIQFENKHVFVASATGSGKTLPIILGPLMKREMGTKALTIIIVPLIDLGVQHQKDTEAAGLKSICLNSRDGFSEKNSVGAYNSSNVFLLILDPSVLEAR